MSARSDPNEGGSERDTIDVAETGDPDVTVPTSENIEANAESNRSANTNANASASPNANASTRTPTPPTRAIHTGYPTRIALGAVVIAFGIVAGPLGVVAGLLTAVVWHVVGAPAGLAAGHVALVGLFPTGIDPLSFGIVEAAFLSLLAVSGPRAADRSPLEYAIAALVAAGSTGGVVWLVLGPAGQPVWLTAIVLLALLGCAGYGLARVERVLVSDRLEGRRDDSTTDSTDAPTRSRPNSNADYQTSLDR